MSTAKRKAPAVEIQRRVRVRRESSEELDTVPSSNGDESSNEDLNQSSSSESEQDEVRILASKVGVSAKVL